MDSSQRALQTNEIIFSNFVFEFWPKTEKCSNEQRGGNIDQLQCVIYQWIRLNELYKLMESFFSNFNFVFELLAENRKIFKPREY